MPEPIATSTIVAQAFRLMELGPISSFADDTPQARDAAEQYPEAMRLCLEASDWSFASELAMLPEIADLPSSRVDPALPYTYALPGSCVRLLEVGNETVEWRRDKGVLRASVPGPLRIRFTEMVSDETRLPATFRIAVAYRLAAMLAPVWVGAQNKTDGLEEGAARAMAKAERMDARQASPQRYDGGADGGDWAVEAVR
jgi:hypothetical protein